MAKKPETVFKERVLRALKDLPHTWAEKIQQVTKRGTPDILACVNGHFVALELKSGKRPKTPGKFSLQDWVLKQIEAANGLALKVYPDEWEEAFKHLVQLAGVEKQATREGAH